MLSMQRTEKLEQGQIEISQKKLVTGDIELWEIAQGTTFGGNNMHAPGTKQDHKQIRRCMKILALLVLYKPLVVLPLFSSNIAESSSEGW